MDTIRIATKWGLFRTRIEVEANPNEISLYKRSFPLIGKMQKYATIPTEKVIFWGDNDDASQSKWLWVSLTLSLRHPNQRFSQSSVSMR